ncbi:MAG TPA: methyltransferase [Holophagaceae bacterium]|nr:methyltransferase [Holophagaceae bacterium]
MDASAPPPSALLLQLIAGRWITHMIAVAAELGLADQLGEGPRSAADLARTVGASTDGIHRLMRGLCSVGVFDQTAPDYFANNALSDCLRQDSPHSLRDMARMVAMRGPVTGWLQLEHSVRHGGSAFLKEHGEYPFDYFRSHPEEGRLFHGAMTALSRTAVPALLGAYDFGRFREVADLGGGHGFFLRSLLAAFPGPKAVLFDLPEVLETAPEDDVVGRLRFQGGSFFEEVPRGCDAYFMKHILHDWSDDHCALILSRIRELMSPVGRLLVAELVLPEDATPHFGKLLDIEMLALTGGGRERTAAEFATLFARGGFRLVQVHPTASPICLLEGEPA